MPLRLQDTVLGFLRVYTSDKRTFDKEQTALLLKFTELGTRALENTMSHERLRSGIEDLKKYFPVAIYLGGAALRRR